MEPHSWIAAAGALLLVIALTPRLLRSLDLSSALLALVVGVLLGPHVLGVVEPARAGMDTRTLETLALMVVTVTLMASGLRITRRDLTIDRRPAVRLLVLGTPGMWLATAAAAWLVLGLDPVPALLLGAVLAPTDPVIASSLVTGRLAERHLPRRVRRTLEIEAGANDGLALPLVLACVLVLTESRGDAALSWLAEGAAALAIGAALGVATGVAVGRLTMAAVGRHEEEPPLLDGLAIAVALAAVGGVQLLGGAAVLAVFAAAVGLSLSLGDEVRRTVGRAADVVAALSFPLLFALLGALLPWSEWQALGVGGVVFALLVLVVRRPPIVPIVLAGSGLERRSVLFLGWFGPIGAAALYYAAHVESMGLESGTTLYAAATLVICASIIAHSITATPAVRAFGGLSPLGSLRRPLDPEGEG